MNAVFPQPLQRFLSDFDFPIHERKATCEDCYMARSAGGFAYRGDLKCCTFQPFLYNFQVGAILQDLEMKPQARANLAAFIPGEGSQPLGIAPSIEYQRRFFKTGIDNFGRDENLLCPYFDRQGKRCGIWRWRGGVCTTFYCESSYGLKGIEFWQSTQTLFAFMENTLAFEALLAAGFSDSEIKQAQKFLPQPPPAVPRKPKPELWREFGERRLEIYTKCAEHIMNLSNDAFWQLLGDEGIAIKKQVEEKALSCLP